jgi:hypothetical protein
MLTPAVPGERKGRRYGALPELLTVAVPEALADALPDALADEALDPYP